MYPRLQFSSVIRVCRFVNVLPSSITNLQHTSATSMKKIFLGKDLASVDPALALDRNRRKIVRSLKQKENPHGNGLEGSLFH